MLKKAKGVRWDSLPFVPEEKKGYSTRRTAQRPGGHYTADPEGGKRGGYPGSDRVTKAVPSSLPKNGETPGNWRCPAIICQFPFPTLSLSLSHAVVLLLLLLLLYHRV